MNRLQQTSCSLGCLSWVFDIDGVRWLTLTGTPEAGYRQAATRFSALGGKVDLQVQEVWEEALLAAVECPTVVRQPIPLHLSGTGFQRAVWDALCTIPVGQWRTYGDIAALIGRPRAVRAVGSACGANPLPFLIPCHRVVASGGRWGGFGLGLDVKEVLLFREGMIPGTSGQISAHGRIPFYSLFVSSMITLFINGSPQIFATVPTVRQVLDERGMTGRRVAIECNGDIVPRSHYDSRALAEGDRLEIVVAVGGG